VFLPSGFYDLTNNEGHRRKLDANARCHIYLGYTRGMPEGLDDALNAFYGAHFPRDEHGHRDWI
jgi:hypothetical protein